MKPNSDLVRTSCANAGTLQATYKDTRAHMRHIPGVTIANETS